MLPEPWHTAEAAALLSLPGPESHKYSRGVLGLRTGSSSYPGAAVLGAEAAWRTGVGLVRYVTPLDDSPPAFGLPSPAAAILALRPETVFSSDGTEDRSRCDAWLVGSGTDPRARSTAERSALLELLAGPAPLVVDAGALDLVQVARTSGGLNAPVIITPHLGEFRTLWRTAGFGHDTPAVPLPEPPLESQPEPPQEPQPEPQQDSWAEMPLPARAAEMLASHLGVTVLLKGSRSIAASAAGTLLTYGPATPWLATAGTGDVLAGILGALTATHAAQIREDSELLARLGVTAALLHDTAARIASGDAVERDTGVPITALDVAQALPRAVHQLLQTTREQ